MNKFIPADKLIAEIEQRITNFSIMHNTAASKNDYESMSRVDCALVQLRNVLAFVKTLQQELPEADLDKLVNEEFASHCRTTVYGLVATYNRAELYQFIKRMALVFNERKEETK